MVRKITLKARNDSLPEFLLEFLQIFVHTLFNSVRSLTNLALLVRAIIRLLLLLLR